MSNEKETKSIRYITIKFILVYGILFSSSGSYSNQYVKQSLMPLKEN